MLRLAIVNTPHGPVHPVLEFVIMRVKINLAVCVNTDLQLCNVPLDHQFPFPVGVGTALPSLSEGQAVLVFLPIVVFFVVCTIVNADQKSSAG